MKFLIIDNTLTEFGRFLNYFSILLYILVIPLICCIFYYNVDRLFILGYLLLFYLRVLIGLFICRYNKIGYIHLDNGIVKVEFNGIIYDKNELTYLSITINEYSGMFRRIALNFVILEGTDNPISFRVGDFIVDKRLYIKNKSDYRFAKSHLPT